MAKIYQFYNYTYPVYNAPFCQYGRLSENLPILSIKSRNGQQHGASSTTTMKPTTLKYTGIKIVISKTNSPQNVSKWQPWNKKKNRQENISISLLFLLWFFNDNFLFFTTTWLYNSSKFTYFSWEPLPTKSKVCTYLCWYPITTQLVEHTCAGIL